MTICIAGIAENKKIVAFTDRMLTISAPVRTAFEITENNKAIKLANKVVAMFAGDVLKANSILEIAKSKIEKQRYWHRKSGKYSAIFLQRTMG